MHLLGLLAAEGDDASNFVDIDVQPWQWGVLLAIIVSLLMVDILVIHRKPHVIHVRRGGDRGGHLGRRAAWRSRSWSGRGSGVPRPASTCRAT